MKLILGTGMVLLHKIRGRHAKLTLKRFGKRRMGAEPALIGYLRYRIKTFLLRIGKEGIESINAHAMYIADQSEAWPGSFQSNLPKISKWTLFPIPQTVIDTNTGAVIEQNPGWN